MRVRAWGNELKKKLNTWIDHPERFYLVAGLIGVIGFALITPPFQGPDERAHYVRMQYVAHGYFLAANTKEVGAALPHSVQDVMNSTELQNSISGGGLKKYDISKSRALKDPFDSGETYQPPMISYTGVSYLPAAPAVAFANALNVSALASMYIARLSLGIFCVILTFYSIRLLSSRRYLFIGIALIPMLLFQQSVISTDGVSYALLLSFICFVLYLYQKKDVNIKEWLGLGVLCAAITLAKPLVFLFLPFVIILIRKKNALKWIAGMALLCIVLFGSLTLYNSRLSEASIDPNVPDEANSTAQLANLKDNPARFLRVMWNSYMTSHGDDEVQGVFGIFGSADTVFPLWMIIGYIIVLALLASVKLEKFKETEVPPYVKYILIFLAVIYFVLVNLAIYLSFTPFNFNIIYGVQGRYFLPLLIILPLFITPFLAVDKKQRKQLITYSFAAVIIFVLLALFITMQRYYFYTP